MPYEYTFVRLKNTLRTVATADYQQAIRDQAAEGWRLVDVFAPGDAFGSPPWVDLIFERPAE